MQNTTMILFGLAMLAYASTRSPDKTRSSRFHHLRGWQKILGILAVFLTLLMILNPDSLALGLFGDTAFFDIMVFALSVQMSVLATRAIHSCVDVLSKVARGMGIPSPGLRYLLAFLTPVIASASSLFQKAAHRILS
jgi:hypothetical protein